MQASPRTDRAEPDPEMAPAAIADRAEPEIADRAAIADRAEPETAENSAIADRAEPGSAIETFAAILTTAATFAAGASAQTVRFIFYMI